MKGRQIDAVSIRHGYMVWSHLAGSSRLLWQHTVSEKNLDIPKGVISFYAFAFLALRHPLNGNHIVNTTSPVVMTSSQVPFKGSINLNANVIMLIRQY